MAYVYDAGGGGRKKEEEERQQSLNHFKLERDEQIMNRNDPGGGVYVKPTQPETSEEHQSYQYTGGQSEKPAEPVYSEEPEPVQEAEAQKPPEPVYTEQPETLAEATENVETEAKPQEAETTQPIVYTGATATTPKTGAENTKADLTDEEQDDAWYAENGLSWAAPRNNAADQSEPKQQKQQKGSNSGSSYEQYTVQPTAAAGTLPGMGRPQGNRRLNVIDLSTVPNDPQYQQRLQLYRSQGYSDASAASAAAGDVINYDAQREANAIAARRRADQAAADNLANTAAVNQIAAQRRADQAAADNLANQNYVNALGAAQRAGYEYNSPTNGYVPTNLLRSEDFNRTSKYNPEQTFYQFSGQNREVGIREDGTIYDRPVEGAAQPRSFWDRVNEGIADSTAQQQERVDKNLETLESRNRQGYQTPAREFVNDMGAARRAGYEYNPPTPTNPATGEPTVDALLPVMGIDNEAWNDKDFQKYYKNFKAQGQNESAALGNAFALYNGMKNDRMRDLTYEIEDRLINEKGSEYSEKDDYDAIHAEAEKLAAEQYDPNQYSVGQKWANDYAASRRAGYEYNPRSSQTTEEQNRESDETLEQQLPGIMASGKSGPTVYDTSQIKGLSTASGEVRAPGATTPTDSDKIPKGSQYFTPSYGQDMEKGVKAPYRQGGYTEDELKKMGNVPRTDRRYNDGSVEYEGYYLAPDGHYYPVDQEKAEYYKATGSYKGWEEGMRKYYQTFGTFYGYKPNWQQTGRNYGGGGRSYSYRGYSRNSGGGGGSYGSGSPANNGLYWNPNSSWSI